MNPILFLAAGGMVVAGAGGFYLWDQLQPEDRTCDDGDLSPRTGDVPVRFTARNDGGAAVIHLCAFDDGGRRIASIDLDVPEGTTGEVEWMLPSERLSLIAEVTNGGGHAVSAAHMDLTQCPTTPVQIAHAFSITRTSVSIDGLENNCLQDGGSGSAHAISSGGGDVSTMGAAPAKTGAALPVHPAAAWGAVGFGLLAVPFVQHRQWAAFAVAAGFSRLVKPKLLDQRVRAMIHQLVTVDPGIHTSEILESLEEARGTVAHHLRVLTREGLLATTGGPVLRHYFPAGRFSPAQMRRMAALRNPRLERTYQALLEQPGMSLSHLARRCGTAMPLASKRVRLMERAGLVRCEREGRTLRLFPVT